MYVTHNYICTMKKLHMHLLFLSPPSVLTISPLLLICYPYVFNALFLLII